MHPFFTFYGGKYRAAPHYPDPQFGTIVEPFAGAAGYSVRHHARRVILVERDPNVAATWRYLLRVSPAEVLALPDLAPGQSVDDLAVCPEARLLIGWYCGRGLAAPRKTQSVWISNHISGMYGNGPSPCIAWGSAIRQRIAAQVGYIRHWTIIEGTYRDAPDIEATWFIDPPYAVAGKHYRFGASTIDYGDLADFCRERQGQVMVCENEGATWLPFRPFRSIKASEGKYGGKVSREALWTNEPLGLFDPSNPIFSRSQRVAT